MFESPQLLCYGRRGTGPRLQANTILNVHVIANAGKFPVELHSDGWTVRTRDKKDSALFSVMVRIHADRAELISEILS